MTPFGAGVPAPRRRGRLRCRLCGPGRGTRLPATDPGRPVGQGEPSPRPCRGPLSRPTESPMTADLSGTTVGAQVWLTCWAAMGIGVTSGRPRRCRVSSRPGGWRGSGSTASCATSASRRRRFRSVGEAADGRELRAAVPRQPGRPPPGHHRAASPAGPRPGRDARLLHCRRRSWNRAGAHPRRRRAELPVPAQQQPGHQVRRPVRGQVPVSAGRWPAD